MDCCQFWTSIGQAAGALMPWQTPVENNLCKACKHHLGQLGPMKKLLRPGYWRNSDMALW